MKKQFRFIVTIILVLSITLSSMVFASTDQVKHITLSGELSSQNQLSLVVESNGKRLFLDVIEASSIGSFNKTFSVPKGSEPRITLFAENKLLVFKVNADGSITSLTNNIEDNQVSLTDNDGCLKLQLSNTIFKDNSSSSNSHNSSSSSPEGVPVYMRIVGYDEEIFPRKLIYVKNFDLTPYLGEADGSSATESTGWDTDKFPKGPSHAHAVIKALESIKASYDFQDYGWGVYMTMIEGERQFDMISTSGWMYDVNGSLPNVGSQGRSLSDNDEVTWYFSAYGFDAVFPKIKLNKKKITKEDSIEITVKDRYKGNKALQDAIVVINGEETSYKTDDKGKVTVFFDGDGYYDLSVVHKKNGLYDMVLPESLRVTVGNPKNFSKSSGKTLGIIKKVKENIVTQYTDEYSIIRREDATEKDVVDCIDNVRDKVYGAMLKMDTTQEAIELSSKAQDASELIRWSIDKIETPSAAEATLSYTNDLMDSIAKSSKFLATVDEKKQEEAVESILLATKANVDNTLQAVDTIISMKDEAENTDKLITDFSENVLAIKDNIDSEDVDQLDAYITESVQNYLSNEGAIATQTRDDGFVAVFDEKSFSGLKESNKAAINLTNKLIEMTDTEPIKPIAPKVLLAVESKQNNKTTAYIDKVSLDEADLPFNSSVLVKSQTGSLEIPRKVLNSNKGSQIKVSFTKIPREEQSDHLKSFIKNDSQVIDVSLSVNKINKTHFDEAIEVSIPYKAGKSIEHKLVVYHDRGDGTYEKFAGLYNPKTQMVSFKTNHLSKFFVKPATPKFDDVTKVQWAKKSIERLSALDIIKGKDDFNFMPEEKVTRAEFATMLSRLMDRIPNQNERVSVKKSFDDINENQWYSPAVNQVVSKGWMNGKSDDHFDPNGYISKQEIACVMAKILTEYDYKLSYSIRLDDEVATWAQPSVRLLNQLGITASLTSRGFNPTEKVQRDEVAVLLDELSKVLIEN